MSEAATDRLSPLASVDAGGFTPVLLLPECSDPDAVLLCVGHEACRILDDAGIPYMVGGGVAVWAYGRRRKTKDIDLFLYPSTPEEAMNSLARRGFHTRETEAGWLYKAIKADVIIDLIVWTTGAVTLDAASFAHARSMQIDGYSFLLMGPEDVLFRKILSHKEERFDWYDAMSIMVNAGELGFDWPYFLTRAQRFPKRVLSFLLYAQGELGAETIPVQAVPPEILHQLIEWTGLCRF